MKELTKTYAPGEIEERLYKYWEDGGFFAPSGDTDNPPYTIVIPPPNVTSQLHMGHALDCTLQDILVRHKRMQGFNTLWIPGTDHAGIATQVKVEESLREQGISKYDLGREEFLSRVWAWREKYGSIITDQLKKLGSSCDWSRERFTMDEGCSAAVRETFCTLYERDLIYRGFRIINWCPSCTTALSDAEVEHEEREGSLWHIRYPIVDGSGHVTIATTRPETMLGDVAVAVNPTDQRYAHLVGKMLRLPLADREIPIIADDYVESDFGTGCVKITPAHDPNDFEMGERHRLPHVVMMDKTAKINENGDKYAGMERYAARKAIVSDLEALGLLDSVKPHTLNAGTCYRCSAVVEPMTSDQWFVRMQPFADPAISAVENSDIAIKPERFEKTYFNWMNNLRDWCISRQIWWGHRIPAFYCDDCGAMEVAREDISACPKCGGAVRQDEDVLDTWFSSALWPFSTLGWPEKTEELALRYPTSTLVTGYDIIFFWVARMVVMGQALMGDVPFDTVFLHGLVRDAEGKKMSKSAGNGIDPLEVIGNQGADALRFALVGGSAPGADMRMSDERIEAGRNFNNKLWNAARFVMMHVGDSTGGRVDLAPTKDLELADRWILSLLNKLVREVGENLDGFELGVAHAKLYDFTWDIFCDWYIELAKPRLFDDNADRKAVAVGVLDYVLGELLKLWHPFLPFITEELWQHLRPNSGSVMVAAYPTHRAELCFPEEEERMAALVECIRAIRNRRAEMKVPMGKRVPLTIVTTRTDVYNSETATFFEKMAGAAESGVTFAESYTPRADDVSIVTPTAVVYIPMAELMDIEKEVERLEGERKKALAEIAMVQGKLGNAGFVAKAPPAVIEKEQEKLTKYRALLESIERTLEGLASM